jgi:hypothetical protein
MGNPMPVIGFLDARFPDAKAGSQVLDEDVCSGFGRQIGPVAHHRLPAIYTGREYCEHGGLMSYGTNIADASVPCRVTCPAITGPGNHWHKHAGECWDHE